MSQIERHGSTKQQLKAYYAQVLTRYLLDPGDLNLQEAQQVGQRALGAGPSLREMAQIHHEALSTAVGRMNTQRPNAGPEAPSAIRAAGAFFTSSLQPFETRQLESEQAAAVLRQQNWNLEEQAGRISHAIYDDTLQLVAATHLLVHAMAQTPAVDPGQFAQLVSSLTQIESRLNVLSYELRPCVLDHLGLEAAVDWLGKYFASKTALKIEIEASVAVPLSARLATALYRAVEESLRNIVAHARATRVRICVREDVDSIACSIVDNGIGFDAAPVFAARGDRGFGLIGIRENIRSFGGTMTVESSIGGGTGISIMAPVKPDAPPRRKRRRTDGRAAGR